MGGHAGGAQGRGRVARRIGAVGGDGAEEVGVGDDGLPAGVDGGAVERVGDELGQGAGVDLPVVALDGLGQGGAHRTGAGPAAAEVALEGGHHHVAEVGGVGGHPTRRRRNGRVVDRVVQLDRRRPAEEPTAARRHLVQAHPEGEEVGAAVEGAGGVPLLRRHVRKLALDAGHLRLAQGRLGAGDAEVYQLDGAVLGDEDVVGGDVLGG